MFWRGLPFLLGALLPAVSSAYESNDFTVGVHAGTTVISHPDVSGNSPEFEMLSLGYHFNRAITIEGRVGSGLQLLKHDDNSGIDSMVGGYLRLQYPVNAPVGLYAIAGVAMTDYDIASAELRDISESYGGGIAIRPVEYAELVLEAMQMNREDEIEIRAYTLGFRFYY